jgi:uncharacterized protein with HEPN domain
VQDILNAIAAIREYTEDGLKQGMVFDAVRMRLVEIGGRGCPARRHSHLPKTPS